eukprot:TRINITY_DN67179_c10_g8_i1.p2 TRINITY_DN67179_c10_g8~~TRINITY_DN67179_c10_g8_i1.p2  ORF type:complete len:292 (+),score=140.82 TRINITY_DN67179_c10_g8_i1:1899-2774(+)
MLRRNARLRREYLWRKSLSGAERAEHEKKLRLKKALDSGKPVPAELRREAERLEKEIRDDDAVTGEIKTSEEMDNEYATAGVQDPRVLVTTSRDPSSRLTQFAKELRLVLPNAQRINRGNAVVKEIVAAARDNEMTDVVIVHEHRGEPDGLIVCHLPYGPTAYFGLSNCVLRHDIPDSLGTMSEQYPHLIFHNFSTKLGSRLMTILKHLFPVPKEDARRVMSFVNRNDSISFRHHMYKKTGAKKVDLQEVGPRFEMKLYQIKLGTVDMAEAQNEWVLRPYMNSAKNRKVVG